MSRNSSSSDEETAPKRRKGISHENTYKRNVVRTARVQGEAYVSYKGKQIPQKTIPEVITCKCTSKCNLRLNRELISQIWKNFYALGSKNTQDTHLQNWIEVSEIKRRRARNEAAPEEQCEQDVGAQQPPRDEASGSAMTFIKKKHSFIYFLRLNGKLERVCKNVFIQAHGISVDRVRRICNLLVQNKTPNDMRGKNRSDNAIRGDVCLKVHEQISRFQVKETHYGGKPKKYLDARLSVVKMHEMFQNENPDLKDVVKYNFYYQYFKENFNYSFGRPQVDECSQCESLSAKLKDTGLTENAKRNVAAELMIHKRRAKKFYTALKAASENKDDDTVALSFDYMQNLPLPLIPVQEVFYMRQLWVNVFCIHDVKTNKAKLYLYHEGEANKSPNEVCSFLSHYIQSEVPSTVKKLILFSDGAAGHNKNHTVVRFVMNWCDRGKFEKITHFFPVRGHSFLPCDRDFGSIKRLLRKTDRIYTPQEYAELIVKASNVGRFSIHEVKSDEILSFKEWWPRSYRKLTNSDETSGRGIRKDQRDPFKISSFKEFVYTKDMPGKVIAKTFIDGALSSTFSLLKTNTATELPSQKAYPVGKVPINKKKLDDLQKLVIYTIGYEQFYGDILKWPTTEAECQVDSEFEDLLNKLQY